MLRLVINLDESLERYDSMKSKLSTFDLTFERVSAINGQTLDAKTVDYFAKQFSFSRQILCPRKLSKGEIGCFLSHRTCWDKLCQSNENFALIMEDDIQFSNRSFPYLKDDSWIPKYVDLIQLSTLTPLPHESKIGAKLELDSGDSLIRPLSPIPYGTQAYIISKQAAQFAIQITKNLIPAPVDDFLFNPFSAFSLRYPLFKLNPSIVTHDELNKFASTIFEGNLKKCLIYNRYNLLRLACKLLHQLRIRFCSKTDRLYYR